MVSPKQLLSIIESSLLGPSPPTPAQRVELIHAIRSSLSSFQSLLSFTVRFPHSSLLLVWLLRKFLWLSWPNIPFLCSISRFFLLDLLYSVDFPRLKWTFWWVFTCPSLVFTTLNLFCSLLGRQIGLRCNRRKLGFRIRRRFRLMIRMSRL